MRGNLISTILIFLK